MSRSIALLFLIMPFMGHTQSRPLKAGVEVCVYGGTAAGVIAAYTAQKLHKNVLLVEPGHRLGGLSSGGLGFTDIGNKYVVTGLARDFYRRVGQYYGRFEQWIFEPKVAEAIFLDYIKRSGCKVVYGKRLKKVNKTGAAIVSIELENSDGSAGITLVKAQQYIDCSYEGDLMAAAGVGYTTGRESNALYNETVNGVQLRDKHQFPDGIDPYIVPGKPESGLLWGISSGPLAETGSGDKKIQAYNFRICLSDDPSNQIAITRPAHYSAAQYELLLRYLAAKPSKDLWGFLKMDLMPNHKTDINNNGPFSTDMIGMNYGYPDGDFTTRADIIKQHENYTKGLLYFIGHDERMPEHLRKQMLQWGYPKDEYINNGNWTPQLYIRESRRMLGAYIMTEANCLRKEVVKDGVGMAAYTMDSHNCERIVVNGMVKNEGDVQLKGVQPYPVSYRAITPKVVECNNLLVPVCLSASHMAYGSIRMEPVFMVLAQSAALATCMAIDGNTTVQQIDTKQLQARLKTNPLADNSIPEILVDNDDSEHIVVKGEWKKETNGGYGPSLLISTTRSGAEARFIPTILQGGTYTIYIYCPKLQDASTGIPVKIFDGRKTVNTTVNKNDIKVSGQTSGEWVFINRVMLPAGNKAYVQVSTDGADGAVAADAVLFVPVQRMN